MRDLRMYQPSPRHMFGRFEVLARLGQGGMAQVFRAREWIAGRPGREVALKRLRPELADDFSCAEQFATEADVLRMLCHPNIVRFYEAGYVGETFYLSMELVDGADLGRVIEQCRGLKVMVPPGEAMGVARTVLIALEHAHAARGRDGRPLKIVHQDISPGNVFVSRTGEVKLGDFGVASVEAYRGGEPQVGGKASYASPELLCGDVTAAVDLWATAVMLFELLTLRRPFEGGDFEEIAAAVRQARPPKPSSLRKDLSPEVDAFFARAFDPAAGARFGSATEMGQALERLYDPDRVDGRFLRTLVAGVVRGQRPAG